VAPPGRMTRTSPLSRGTTIALPTLSSASGANASAIVEETADLVERMPVHRGWPTLESEHADPNDETVRLDGLAHTVSWKRRWVLLAKGASADPEHRDRRNTKPHPFSRRRYNA